jgi:C4-dicarboxylate-specific signal transduction histidine kinase
VEGSPYFVFLFFVLVKVSPAFYPSLMIHLITAFLYGAAVIGFLRKGLWKSDDFEHWLVVSLAVAVTGEIAFSALYSHLYDPLFVASHVAKLLTKLSVMVGLSASMYSTFKREAESAKHLLTVNETLALEIAQRKKADEQLRKAHDDLEERVKTRTADLAQANQALRREVTERSRAEQAAEAASQERVSCQHES